MCPVRAFLPAFGAGLAFTLGGPGEKVTFQPQAGSTLTKSFEIGGEFTLDDISLIADGQDVAGMVQIEMTMRQESKIEVTDSYKAVAGGRPTELLRTFEALSSTMIMEVSPAEEVIPQLESTSELEGKTVSFRWNEEKQEYERSFHEESGDEELLEDLEEDMDLRVFLPASEVSEDDTWSVELGELDSVAMPGGNLRMIPEGVDIDEDALKMVEEIIGDFGEELGDLLEGECKCTYKGAREEGGVQVAEIAIELEVATTLDLSELLNKAIRAAIEESGEEVDFSVDNADLTLDFEGEGTLLWNLGAGRMQSFHISGDATIGIDLAVSVEAEDESHELDGSLEFSGSMRQEVVTTE